MRRSYRRGVVLSVDDVGGAIQTNYDVASEVRAAVQRMGGTMPEDLPAETNIKKLLTAKQRRV
jgi:hypothetical protein